jgi:SAM-dependent methyltransferase
LGDYAQAAAYYDLLYASIKDYADEARILAELIREAAPEAERVLDVACGTGQHAMQLYALGFSVDGVDLEPAFVEIASERNPSGTFQVADMMQLALPQRYDAVVCLFSAIGYARTLPGLHDAVARMAAHVNPGGLLIIDPWFEPGELTDRWISVTSGAAGGRAACRMSRTLIDGDISRLEFEYLLGGPEGIERRAEVHELGLFTQAQMEQAFRAAGFSVERRLGLLRMRGVYLGRQMVENA